MPDLVPYEGAREVVTRSPARSVGIVNAPHVQPHPIEYESENERNFVVSAILCPWLSVLIHQPVTLKLGRKEYTPDFGKKFSDGSVAITEVKMAHRVKENRSLFNAAAAALRAKGREFYVVHDGQSNAQGRAERAEFVKKYAAHVISPGKRAAISALVGSAGARGVPIGQVMESCMASRWDLLHMVSVRVITLDRYLHMSDDDRVFRPPAMPSKCSKHFGEWFGCAPWNDGTSGK